LSGNGQHFRQGKQVGGSNTSPMTNPAQFEEEWNTLRPRIIRLLSTRGATADVAEDITQETAIRLLKNWDRMDLGTPLWPYVRRIALNALVDRHRSKTFETFSEIPEAVDPFDLEEATVARARLSAVWSAMGTLSPRERNTLLAEVGFVPSVPNDSATKMARLRARKKLSAAVDRTGAFCGIPLLWRRTSNWLQIHTPTHMIDATAAAGLVVMVSIATVTLEGTAPGATVRSDPNHRSATIEPVSARRALTARPTRKTSAARSSDSATAESVAPSPAPASSMALAESSKPAGAEAGPARAEAGRREGVTYVQVCTGEDTDTPYDDTDTTIVLYDPEPDEDDGPTPKCKHGQ